MSPEDLDKALRRIISISNAGIAERTGRSVASLHPLPTVPDNQKAYIEQILQGRIPVPQHTTKDLPNMLDGLL